MRDELVFHPPTRLGYIFHVVVMAVLMAAAGLGIWGAAQANVGPTFLLFLLPALLAVSVVPVLAYQLYSLRNAAYLLERDGIRLRWGLRVEEIPMNAVTWVHSAAELSVRPSLPRLRWPGSLRGMGRLPGMGEVEFMAAHSRDLVLVATPERIYALSPADTGGFLAAFQRITEMGSLSPIPARSVYPTVLLQRVWAARPARLLLLSGTFFSLALLVWASLVVPGRTLLPLGFRADTSPGAPGPAVRLLLLPIINGVFFLADTLIGLFFFRRDDSRPLAYLLWGVGSLTALLFLLGIFFILRVSPG